MTAVFRVVTSCSTVEIYRRFRGLYCVHHQGRQRGAATQKTAVFMLTAVRTSNSTKRLNFSVTCVLHIQLTHSSLFVYRVIIGENYKLLRTSLCKFATAFCNFIPLRYIYSPQHRIFKFTFPVRHQIFTHVKKQAKLQFCIFQSLWFCIGGRKLNSELCSTKHSLNLICF
jgi:hypothetical protein